jgi:GDPmannose 4,6-dehydratase
MQWLMLQQPEADDYVIATGRQFSVRDFVTVAAAEMGLSVRWEGMGVEEQGVDASGKAIVRVDPRYFRPTEVETLLGDPSKAHSKLGWKPRITFEQLVTEMVAEDLRDAERDSLVSQHGYRAFDRHE